MAKNIYLRNGILWARFKVAGIEYRESLRTRSMAVAEKRLKARKDQVLDQARYGIAGPQSWMGAVISWATFMEHEVRTKSISSKTVQRYATSLNECRQWLDPRDVHEVNAECIRELVKGRRAQKVTNATIRRDLTAIASVLDHAIEEQWTDENSARAYPRARLKERRDPIVLPDDASIAYTLGRQATRFGDLMLFARETGMRQEEIVLLEHSALDTARRTVTVIGKRNRLRIVPLSPAAIEIAQRQPRFLKCPFVFWHLVDGPEGNQIATSYNNVSSNFADYTARAEQRAKLAGIHYRRFNFHDLRHLFAVEYLRDGRGGIYDLQRILGHTSVKTTEIYLDYLTPEQATAARIGVAQKGAHKLRSGERE